MTRDEILNIAITFLHNNIKHVGPGKDLPMLVIFEDGEEDGKTRVGVAPLVIEPDTDKDALMVRVRAILRQKNVEAYATISASWVVNFDTKNRPKEEVERLAELMQEHGSAHPELKPMRVEVYVVTAGDRDGTTMTVFDIKRDRKGRIRRLARRTELEQGPGMITAGRMVDLLADPRH